MKVSVVLCTYAMERFPDFAECVESLLGQTYEDVEIVIVVDGTEDVYERARDRFGDEPGVAIHCNDRNRGLLESRNRGAELASGDVVAFIDDDAIADERWIETLVEAYKEQDAIAVGGRTEGEWVAGTPQFLPEEFYWLVAVTHRGFPEGPCEVRNTFGTNISFRRDAFLDLDGFDAAIGGRKGNNKLQGGETELCARMRSEYGAGVWYTPEATVAHKVFEDRTRFGWLLKRAFWQGYSKRAMESIVPQSGGEEGDYLRRLLFEFVPERFRDAVRSPSTAAALQLFTLFVLTGAVGAGYTYGVLRW